MRAIGAEVDLQLGQRPWRDFSTHLIMQSEMILLQRLPPIAPGQVENQSNYCKTNRN